MEPQVVLFFVCKADSPGATAVPIQGGDGVAYVRAVKAQEATDLITGLDEALDVQLDTDNFMNSHYIHADGTCGKEPLVVNRGLNTIT